MAEAVDVVLSDEALFELLAELVDAALLVPLDGLKSRGS